ncbi:polysaccharide biosynthesis tyrosine autokinase [Egicoccus halophilus]|uniref:ExoP n=1 Tax=Egicoccus halophilus TaxID=1670830 RepID=A0A8J3A7F0_9ACTN|nr:polysaccharide biosynthesis tyrosine autokinase [Egicoccus halophilus]GGI05390.1 exoP [Egicoccus halophilus]
MSRVTERGAESPSVVGALWRFRWLVLAVTVVAAVGGFLLSRAQPPVYETSTVLYLTDPGSSAVFGGGAGTNLDRYVPQQAERAMSTPVKTLAAEALDDGTTADDLHELVEVTGDVELATLEITVTGDSPGFTAAAADAMAEAYQEAVRTAELERADRAASELETAAADIEAQVQALGEAGEDEPALLAQVNVLTQRLLEVEALSQQLRVDARLFGAGVEFVEQAEEPLAPVSPAPVRDALIAALLGALLGGAVAYWLAGRGQRVTSSEQPSQVLGVPLLGSLPTYDVDAEGTLRHRVDLEPLTAEAYRFVYTSLELLLRETGARSVMVTSARPKTGKTETALQLAVTAQTRGRRTLLVDADFRMQGLTRFLRSERERGLLDLEDTTREPLEAVTAYPYVEGADLGVLTTGRVGGEGTEQLRESWFGHAFPQLTQHFDLTVVDSPPLLAIADAATVAAYTDAVVLVVREGMDLADLERVRERLRFVGQRLVGYVYLSPSALENSSFDYGLVRAQANRPGASRPANRPGSLAPSEPTRS